MYEKEASLSGCCFWPFQVLGILSDKSVILSYKSLIIKSRFVNDIFSQPIFYDLVFLAIFSNVKDFNGKDEFVLYKSFNTKNRDQ